MWVLPVVVACIFSGTILSRGVYCSDYDVQLKVLSKQVTALLDRRKEDIKNIEENVRRSVYDSPEIMGLRNEVKSLRLELERVRSGKILKPDQDKNDVVTIKWLYNSMSELKTELADMQMVLNSSSLLQKEESTKTQINLLKSDVSNLNAELEMSKRKNAKYEADLEIFNEEFNTIKENFRSIAVMCGKTKNQLKAMQMDWNQNWKTLNEKTPSIETEIITHPSRHQKIMKQHIIRLEKSTKTLHKENFYLKTKVNELEEEIRNLMLELRSNEQKESRKLNEITKEADNTMYDKFINITKQQTLNTIAITNISRQLDNFDKLHLSFLELLENVESIETKVDKNFPEFRKEISKLEIQAAETSSAASLLREDQKNVIDSLKAIGFSVSTMQDKNSVDHKRVDDLEATINNLAKSSAVQNSKLHDHILKEESNSVNLNATKATIHLVQELKSFESEYKSIVNKLPRDCSTVEGPSGIYLISPGDGEPILAHCEEGWTTVQKRYDGSLNFNRNWNEYSNGFGSATGEHWLGNKNLHYLTKQNCSQLQINMKDIYGKYWQANYEDFRVADFSMGFKLSISRYNGNASDALNYQNLMEFSTVDNDRDISNTHCASNYEGGWWFSHCQHANLNGRYNLGLTWFDSSRNEWIAVANSEMKVKRRDVC